MVSPANSYSSWCDRIAIAFIAFLFMLLLIILALAVMFLVDVSILQYLPIRLV